MYLMTTKELEMGRCVKCGGDMFGDGYTKVEHCEYADDDIVEMTEPDANPIYCDYDEEE